MITMNVHEDSWTIFTNKNVGNFWMTRIVKRLAIPNQVGFEPWKGQSILSIKRLSVEYDYTKSFCLCFSENDPQLFARFYGNIMITVKKSIEPK